tara:strand:- start:1448 stop:1666 length:219 start_codon:yes stop_codon:yes gene_type:complete
MVDDKTVKFTTSAGVSPFFGTENPVELISHATQALDLAILEGRNRFAGFMHTPRGGESGAHQQPAAKQSATV